MPPARQPQSDASASGSAEPPSTVDGSRGPPENARTKASDRAHQRATGGRNDLEDRRRQTGLDGSFRRRRRRAGAARSLRTAPAGASSARHGGVALGSTSHSAAGGRGRDGGGTATSRHVGGHFRRGETS